MSGFSFRLAQRQIAVDLGSRCVKVLVAEAGARGMRIVRHLTVDLRDEGLLSAGEIDGHLQGLIRELGDHPVALAVPQPLTVSQVIDLPPVGPAETGRLIEEQTAGFRNQNSSAVIYDYAPLQPHGKLANPWWVTLAREEEIQRYLQRFAEVGGGVSEITTPANALVAAYRATQPAAEDVVLVDLGARTTLFAVVHAGQGVCAAHFPGGSEAFTEAIAGARSCSYEQAETLKLSENLLLGESRLPALCQAVAAWFQGVEKLWNEWRAANANLAAAMPARRFRLSGGGAAQAGLAGYLRDTFGVEITTWPKHLDDLGELAVDRFAVAYGIALTACQRSPQPVSLLPPALRAVQEHRKRLTQLNAAGAAGLLVAGLLLLFGCWQKFELAQQKKHLIRQAEQALDQAEQILTLSRQRDDECFRLRPVLEQQQQTVDLLSTLRVMRHSRAQKEFWYVLLADQQSYAWGSTLPPPATNELTVATNAPAEPARTNAATFIAEVCIPGDGDRALKTLSDLAAELKQEPLFRRVDSLPAAEKRNWVDAKVLVPDRQFSLFLELAGSGLPRPAMALRRADARAVTNVFKRSVPSLRTNAEVSAAVAPETDP